MLNYHYDLEMLLERLKSRGELKPFLSDIFSFQMARSSNREIDDVLFDPQVKPESKQSYADGVLGSLLSESFLQFLAQLIRNGDSHYFDALADRFIELVSSSEHTTFAEVSSVIPLTREQMDRIRDHLSRITGEEVFVHNILSASLLGGFTIKLRGKILDLSVQKDLRELRGELTRSEQAR